MCVADESDGEVICFFLSHDFALSNVKTLTVRDDLATTGSIIVRTRPTYPVFREWVNYLKYCVRVWLE